MNVILFIIYCTLCTLVNNLSVSKFKYPAFLNYLNNTYYSNIYNLRDDIPIQDQFNDSNSEYGIDSELNVSEDQFKSAATSAIQLSTLGIDWIKVIEELKDSDDCAISTNTLAYNAAISSAAKNSDFDKAVELFNEIKREDPEAVDVVTYKMLILASELAGKYDRAIAFYNDFIESDIKPDYGLLTSVLRCCSHVGYGEFANKTFNEIKRITDPKVTDYDNVIKACIISNDTNGAFKHYNELLKSALTTDLIKSTQMLISHVSFNMNGKFLDTLWEIINQKDIKIGKKSFVDFLYGFYNCSKFDVMESVWNKLSKNYGNECGNLAYQIMLKKYAIFGDCVNAGKMLNDMQNLYKEDMNDLTFTSAIESCISSGESKLAINFLRKGQSLGIKVSINMLNALFKVCEKSESWNDIILIYEQNETLLKECMGRDLLEAKIYYLLANYHLNRNDKLKIIIGELSELQKYSFPFAVKIQHFIQQNITNV